MLDQCLQSQRAQEQTEMTSQTQDCFLEQT